MRYHWAIRLAVLASFGLASCALFYEGFPEDLQGRWEHQDAFYYEWFIIDGSELYYCRSRIAGSIVEEKTMYLLEMDEAGGRFRTTDFFILFQGEGADRSFAYAEGGYPAAPEWKDVHLR